MKKPFYLAGTITFILLLAACQFSVGTKKDLKTGLSISYNGFTADDAYLINAAGKRMENNYVPLNTNFSIVVTGVGNYTLKNGKAYPGCEITVKDISGKIMGTLPDVMSNAAKNGFDPANAVTLTATVSMSPPFKIGETYHVIARFFDKQNPKNKLTAEVDVVLMQ